MLFKKAQVQGARGGATEAYFRWYVEGEPTRATTQIRLFQQHDAGVAQLVEQLICNQQVAGSNPIAS